MTHDQAERLIALLESIDRKLSPWHSQPSQLPFSPAPPVVPQPVVVPHWPGPAYPPQQPIACTCPPGHICLSTVCPRRTVITSVASSEDHTS